MIGKYTAALLDPKQPATGADVNANLLRIEQSLRGIVSLEPTTITTNQTLPIGQADLVEWTLGGNVTLTIDGTKGVPGTQMVVALTQDGTGSRLVTFSGVVWLSGTAPKLRTTANGRDVFQFISLGATSSVLGLMLEPSVIPWTPTDNSGAGLVFTNASGTATKNGPLVVAHGRVTYPATVDGSSASIGGLPYTIGSHVANSGGATVGYTTEATLTRAKPNEGLATLDLVTAAGGAVTNATMSGDELRFCVFYNV